METMRRPFFIAALVLMLVVVLLEVGAVAVLGPVASGAGELASVLPQDGEVREAYEELDEEELEDVLNADRPPGFAIPYLALVDGLVLFTVGLVGVSMLIGQAFHARVQGVATLIFTLLLIVGAIVLILTALAALLLMVSLLLAVPFGTLAYLALYGFFNRGGASVALGLLMTLKIAFVVCLVLSHQRFLQNRGLVLLVLTSLLGNVIVAFLHGFVPGFLVSITDAVAAIVVGILAVIWALVFLISAVVSVLKALRPTR